MKLDPQNDVEKTCIDHCEDIVRREITKQQTRHKKGRSPTVCTFLTTPIIHPLTWNSPCHMTWLYDIERTLIWYLIARDINFPKSPWHWMASWHYIAPLILIKKSNFRDVTTFTDPWHLLPPPPPPPLP